MNELRIPVTIITGFLGAGKTSLLNKLIGKYPEKKFAIIENEFGEIGIDGGLIATTPEAIFELNNGCICCSLGEDFLFTLEKLLGSYKFDHLLVETTGIADPSAIVDAFISGESIQSRFCIDSVVCVADAVNTEDLMDKQPEVRKQLALADLILLNKTDCINSDYAKGLIQLITKISPMAKIFPVSFANIDEIEILDTKSYSGEAIKKTTLSFCALDISKVDKHPKSRMIINPAKKVRSNHHEIISEGFSFKGSFDVNKFGLWMQNFLYFNKETIFRVKGIISFENTDDQFIFHAVRDSFMFEVGKEWKDEERFSKLVFIGKNISRTELESNLRQLLV
jgi:G3E family GTPase